MTEIKKEIKNTLENSYIPTLNEQLKEIEFHKYLNISEKYFFSILKKKGFEKFAIAFIHSSFANEKGLESYERLEFLGDAIIYLVTTEQVFNDFPHHSPNLMSTIRQKFIKTDKLSEITKRIGLDKLLIIPRSAELPEFSKVFADLYEATVGAIYKIFGYKEASFFIRKTLYDEQKQEQHLELKDQKTVLQEALQAISKDLKSNQKIIYSHKKTKTGFKVFVIYQEKILGEGTGRTKKLAEMQAASKALEKLEILKISNNFEIEKISEKIKRRKNFNLKIKQRKLNSNNSFKIPKRREKTPSLIDDF